MIEREILLKGVKTTPHTSLNKSVEKSVMRDGSQQMKITMPNGKATNVRVTKEGKMIKATPLSGMDEVDTPSKMDAIKAFIKANPSKMIMAGVGIGSVIVGLSILLKSDKKKGKKKEELNGVPKKKTPKKKKKKVKQIEI